MENYHIYEEIGKGEFGYSQVFKGREKKKIEYVALKRYEKCMMNKIVNEVQIMHKLTSPHILKFHDWYETRSAFWLIVEYCTGSDLESLLKQDGHLPETSVRMLGLDILAGLKYIHSIGFLHCDLRPRNFLVDEYGILKISDFKLARKIPKTTLGDEQLESRGHFSYMAPELYSSEGFHSYSSDFWSLGCVLYELRRGVAPFGNDSVDVSVLLERIKEVEPVTNPIVFNEKDRNITNSNSKRRHESDLRDRKVDPTNFNSSGVDFIGVPAISADFADLLLWLLEKMPVNRCVWKDLSSHPFWRTAVSPPKNLPEQTQFDLYCKKVENQQSKRMEMQSLAEVGIGPSELQQITNNQVPMSIPLPMPDITPVRTQVKPTNNTHDDTANHRQRIDDASKLMKGVANSINQDPSGDDYSDGFEPYDEDSNVVSVNSRASKVATNPTKENKNIADGGKHKNGSSLLDATQVDDGNGSNTTLNETFIDLEVNDVKELSVAALLMHVSDNNAKPIMGNKYIENIDKPVYKSSTTAFPTVVAEDIPQLPPAELESVLNQLYKYLYKYCYANGSSSGSSPNTGNSTSSSIVMNANALAERSRLLSYLVTISSYVEVANYILNNNFLLLLLRIIRTPGDASNNSNMATKTFNSSIKSTATNGATSLNAAITLSRTLASASLAYMLRYCGFVQPPTVRNRDDHIIASLIGILKESSKMDSKLKRRVVAALGEAVFYVCSQPDPQDEDGNGNGGQWSLPAGVITVLLKCLKDETDEIVRHYAAKTIENVLSQGSIEYRRRFAIVEIAARLLEMSQHARNEVLQATCGMALSHIFYLVMTNEPTDIKVGGNDAAAGARFIVRVFEKGGLPGIVEALRDGQGQPKLQQAYLNIINIIFCTDLCPSTGEGPNELSYRDTMDTRSTSATGNTAGQVLRPLQNFFLKAPSIIPTLLRLIEHGNSNSVRAKAFLCLQLLCKHKTSILTEHRLPVILMRVIEPYVVQSDIPTSVTQTGSSYNIKVALSMVFFIRSTCIRALQGIHSKLKQIIQSKDVKNVTKTTPMKHSTPIHDNNSAYSRSRSSPGTMTRQTPLSAGTRDKSSRGSASSSKGGSATPIDDNNDVISTKVHVQLLNHFSEMLRSTFSMAAQPALGRFILATGSFLVSSLANVLELIPEARVAANELVDNKESSVTAEAIDTAEQAALLALESIAQVDVVDSLSGICNTGQWPASISKYIPDKDAGYRFVVALHKNLLPVAGGLAFHTDGDVRVLIAASLRRLIPGTLKALLLTNISRDQLCSSLNPYLKCVPQLLQDQAPIPQYTIRLLSDAYSVSPFVMKYMTGVLKQNEGFQILLKVLKETIGTQKDSGDRNGGLVYDENVICCSDFYAMIEKL